MRENQTRHTTCLVGLPDEVLDGKYETRVREYEDEKESLLAKCRKTVSTRVTWHFLQPFLFGGSHATVAGGTLWVLV